MLSADNLLAFNSHCVCMYMPVTLRNVAVMLRNVNLLHLGMYMGWEGFSARAPILCSSARLAVQDQLAVERIGCQLCLAETERVWL